MKFRLYERRMSDLERNQILAQLTQRGKKKELIERQLVNTSG